MFKVMVADWTHLEVDTCPVQGNGCRLNSPRSRHLSCSRQWLQIELTKKQAPCPVQGNGCRLNSPRRWHLSCSRQWLHIELTKKQTLVLCKAMVADWTHQEADICPVQGSDRSGMRQICSLLEKTWLVVQQLALCWRVLWARLRLRCIRYYSSLASVHLDNCPIRKNSGLNCFKFAGAALLKYN